MFDLSAEAASVAADPAIPWENLAGKRVLITGATGLVGSACARTLMERNRLGQGDPLTVACLVRSPEKAAVMLEGYGAEDGLDLVKGDVETVALEDLRADYIIHAACPTASKFFMEHPVETADAIVGGTRHMLDAAREHGAQGFVYVSSMEVYGDGNGEPGLDNLLDEDAVGYVNPTSVRSCYPEGKRMAEQYCCAYASEYQVPACTVRLAQTFGPGIPKDDSRIFALIARQVMAGQDITLKTTGASTRMYVYTADAVSAILIALTKGQPGLSYNVANPATYSSIRGMATQIAQGAATPVQVIIDVDPNAPYPPEHHLPLNTTRMQELGWQPRTDLPHMYANLMAYLKD